MSKYKWWVKERFNPQLGTYYIAEGQMSKKEAKKNESSLYGSNTMIPFDTEEEANKFMESKPPRKGK